MNWQPIESAPIDGTEVLVYCPLYGGRHVIANYYNKAWYDEEYFAYSPTHWMPLPEPPK